MQIDSPARPRHAVLRDFRKQTMKSWLIALVVAGGLGPMVAAVAAPTLEELLATSPTQAAQAAAQRGDTRFMGVPACVANQVPGMPFEPTAWWKGKDHTEPLACPAVVGSVAVERMGRLQQYAKEYNTAMLAHVRSHGLYPLYPWDAEPNHQPTPELEKRITAEADAALDAFYAPRRPASVQRDEDIGAWTTQDGTMSRLFVTSRVSAGDWAKFFQPAQWRAVPTPRDFIRTAHNVAPTYTGSIHGRPAYLFITHGRGRDEVLLAMVLVYDADPQPGAPDAGTPKPRTAP